MNECLNHNIKVDQLWIWLLYMLIFCNAYKYVYIYISVVLTSFVFLVFQRFSFVGIALVTALREGFSGTQSG